MERYQLYTDGAYQPDSQIAGIGGYLLDPNDQCLFDFSESILNPTHFKYHEALALIHGLKKSLELGVKHLDCYSDDVSMRNLLNKETLSDLSISTNPFRKDIFLLKSQFESIQFHHLARTYNKKADRLAGKILRIYNEETLPSRTRLDFIGQEHKFLTIPSLKCEEDDLNMPQICKGLNHYLFFHIFKNDITVDNIDDNNSLTINLYILHTNNEGKITELVLCDSQVIIQKKLTSIGLEMLVEGFKKLAHIPDIGIFFHYLEKPLNKLDLLLRKRAVLPLPDTPLTRRVINASSTFDKIVLHHFPELIEQIFPPQIKYNKKEP